ncbi:MAG: NADP-dependent oxidoreductase [Proteobacteria bacterium]|nr:NADP-dependent oxidoreductase [Pseudomonadota bacterium]MBI3499145.1 NADP-dependent oxidoreductase [Pseudomonadota bacterium]
MSNQTNRRILLASRPAGAPEPGNFRMVEEKVPDPGPGAVLVKVLWLSVDPYMRGRMSAAKSYAKPVEIGEVMTGGVVGEVVLSNHRAFKPGDVVEGSLGWQDYALAEPQQLRKIDPKLAPISTALGVLGMPGMTAYFALLEVCKPVPGDTVVVSGAAGAVGQIVGQIARIGGCRVVGIAGSDAKLAFLKNGLGFDATLNYKTATELAADLGRACPNGVDVYFDNVGGTVTDAVFQNLAFKARIVICGQISQYNLAKPELGPRNLRFMLINRARMEGFLVWDWRDRYPEALRRLAAWIKDGKLKYTEHVTEGLENTPKAFIEMLGGANLGKAIVKVAEPSG